MPSQDTTRCCTVTAEELICVSLIGCPPSAANRIGGDYATKSSSSIAASLGTIIAASAAYIATENTVVPRTLQSQSAHVSLNCSVVSMPSHDARTRWVREWFRRGGGGGGGDIHLLAASAACMDRAGVRLPGQ